MSADLICIAVLDIRQAHPQLPRLQLLTMLPITYESFEEGVEAAVGYHRLNFANGVEPEYRVYRCEQPDGAILGFVEILSDRGEMATPGIYKIMAGMFVEGRPEDALSAAEAVPQA